MDVDGLLVAADRRVVVAHSLEKVASAEDATGLLCQETQNLELGRREGDLLPCATDATALEVDDQLVGTDDAPAECIGEVAVCASQLGLHAAEQLADPEGFVM